MWERAHGLTLDSVYNREGNVAQRSSSLGIESAVFTLQQRVQKCFLSVIFHVAEK